MASQVLTLSGGIPSWLTPTGGNMSYADTRFKVGSISKDETAIGDFATTGVGFKPQSIIFFTSPVTGSNTIYSSWGFDDAVNHESILMKSASNNHATSFSIFVGDGAAWDFEALVKSFDSDGFTLTYTKTGTPAAGTITIYYLAFR